MNDTTLTQLKAVVEQSVRPIRATVTCKKRMREELLAHLVAVFEEELGKTGDEPSAIDQAMRRFGSPHDLAALLQRSVPWWNRCRSVLESLARQPNESVWRLAAKHVLVLLAIYGVVLTAHLFLAIWLENDRDTMVSSLAKGPSHLVVFFLELLIYLTLTNTMLSVVSAWLLCRFGSSLTGRPWGQWLLIALCILTTPLLFSLGFGGSVAIFISIAYQLLRERRCRMDWAC